MKQSKRITEGALFIAVYIALLLLMVFVPFIIIIGIFILPIPFIVYSARHGFRAGLLMFVITLLLSMLFATIISLPLTIFAGIGGIVIGAAMYRQAKAYETWAQGTVGFIIGFVIILAIIQFVMQINVFAEMDAAMRESIEMVKQILGQVGTSNADIEKQLEIIEAQIMGYKDLIPSSIALTSIVFAFISQWLSYKVMNRTVQSSYVFPPFKQMNFPVALIWFYVLALLVSLFVTDPTSSLSIVALNVMSLTMLLIIIQGFSFIFFYADLKKWPVAVPIISVIVTFIFPFLFMFIVRIIGIIDLGFSLKSKLATENKPNA